MLRKITRLLLSFSLITTGIFAQTVTTISSTSTIDDALYIDENYNLYGSNYDGSAVFKITPDGEESIFSNGYSAPNGIAIDSAGYIYLADNTGHNIYKISPEGESEIFIEGFTSPSGLLFEYDSDTLIATGYTANKVVKIAPDKTITEISGLSGMNGPVGLCYDEEYNLYIGNFNDRKIYKITPEGEFSFFAQIPTGVRLGFIAYTNGYIYGTAFQSHRIYRVDLEGTVSLFLGAGAGNTDGDADVARFNGPNGIIPSRSGDTLYVSDYYSKRVRMITNLEGTVSSTNQQNADDIRLSISPNPAKEQANIHFELAQSSSIDLRLFDQSGKLIKEIISTDRGAKGEFNYTLDTKALSPGLYYIQLETNQQQSFLKKLVIIQ